METEYWIQVQAPAGNFVNSIGFGPNLKQARAALKELRKVRATTVLRLVKTEIIPIE